MRKHRIGGLVANCSFCCPCPGALELCYRSEPYGFAILTGRCYNDSHCNDGNLYGNKQWEIGLVPGSYSDNGVFYFCNDAVSYAAACAILDKQTGSFC